MKKGFFRAFIAVMMALFLSTSLLPVQAIATESESEALIEQPEVEETTDNSMRILMVGNSLTRYNNVASKLEQLLAYVSIDATIDTRTQMGASLFDQADILAASTRAAIIEGNYDYVVLQEKSSGFNESLLRQGVGAFKPWIDEAPNHPQLVLYMPWANEDVFSSMQTSFTDAYVAVAKDNGALLAPSGEAYYDLYFNEGKHWYRSGDNVHGNDLASLISASSIFYAILGSEQSVLQFSEADAEVVKSLVESSDYRNNRVNYDTATVNLIEQKAHTYANIYRDLNNVPDLTDRGLEPGTNLALQKQGMASSNARGSSAGMGARNVGNLTDGSYTSFIVLHQEDPDPWFAVDLGSAKTFNHVNLYWGGTGDYADSYNTEYIIEGSNDPENGYTEIATGSSSAAGAQTIFFQESSFRYVRIHVTKINSTYASMYELEVANGSEPDPSEEPSEEPIEEPIEEPSEEPIEKPSEEPSEKPQPSTIAAPGDYLQVRVGDTSYNMSLFEQGMYETTATFAGGVTTYSITLNGEEIYTGSIRESSSSQNIIIRYFALNNTVFTSQDEHEDSNGNPVQDIKKVANWTGNFFNRNGVEEFKEFGGWDQANPLSTIEYIGGGVFARTLDFTLPTTSITYQYKVNFDRVWSNGEIPSDNKKTTIPGGEGSGSILVWANSVTKDVFDSISDGVTSFKLANGEVYEKAIGTAQVELSLRNGDTVVASPMLQTARNAYMATAFIEPGTYTWNNVIDGNEGSLSGSFTIDEATAVTFFFRTGLDYATMLNTVTNKTGFYEATAYAEGAPAEPETPSEDTPSEDAPSQPSQETPAQGSTSQETPSNSESNTPASSDNRDYSVQNQSSSGDTSSDSSQAPVVAIAPNRTPAVAGAITWPVVVSRLERLDLTGTLNINSPKETIIPASVLSMLKGKNTTLAIHSIGGIALSITGTDIKMPKIAASTRIDLSLNSNPKAISSVLIAEKKAIASKQLSIKNTGAFPCTVNLHVALGKENAGKYANLYRLNTSRNQLDYCGSFKIIDIGNAVFAMGQGGDYLVTVTNTAPVKSVRR